MARLPRVVVAGVAHHVTQRGKGRQLLLATDSERMVYLDLLRPAVQREGVSVVGYCLMSNHVHRVVIPRRAEALAVAWPWSSAAAHCGTGAPDACLDLEPWGQRWSAQSWQEFLEEGETPPELDALRRCTHTGRPLGSAEFVGSLEHHTERRLAPQKGGRPRKPVSDGRQKAFKFPKRTRKPPGRVPTR